MKFIKVYISRDFAYVLSQIEEFRKERSYTRKLRTEQNVCYKRKQIRDQEKNC